ncbi:MAG TPA: tRNA (adenosine(37)-N6)-threonylcarbamoyltransferase complex ATPase subunit type 1 TsaE [Vicinamibacterales bacterium]
MSVRITESEAETIAAGRDLGSQLTLGAVVLLEGPLGAGKTAFVRGLALGLGCDGDDVSSPTFTIVQEYRGRLTLQHVDLYRLAPAEVDDLALEDLMAGAVMAVEWPDRWRDPPADAIGVTIDNLGGDRRQIEIVERAKSS